MSLDLLLPEILVVLGALLAVAVDLVAGPERRGRPASFVAGATLLAALVALVALRPHGLALREHFRSDAFSLFVRGLALAGGLMLVLLSSGYTRRMDRGHGEFYGLLLFALLGVMLVSGVTDLMGLFVCLELVTISSYVLAAFKRADVASTEAGLKYLLVGAVSSAFLLFGCALVYGATGTVSFSAISAHVYGKGFSPLLSLGAGLVFLGLFFKVSAVPFHVWAPDVYQGAPSPVTAFLSSLSKSAGFVLLLRMVAVFVVPNTEPASHESWLLFFGIVAGVTLLYGNLAAIPQKNVKRLLAYSSIGHAGYMLLGVTAIAAARDPKPAVEAALRVDGATSVLVYVFAYYVTTLTAFAVVAAVSRLGRGHDTATSYAGLFRRAPLLAFAMLLALLSLAGVPPMAGLIGKFLVFFALVASAQAHPGLYVLGFIGAAGVVISLYYYLLLIRAMYVKEPAEGPGVERLPIPTGTRLAVYLGIVALVTLGVAWGPLHDAAHRAAVALFAAR